MKKMLILALLLQLAFYGSGQNIVGYEYWFDTDFSSKSTTTVNPVNRLDLNLMIPATALSTGIHALNFRAWDNHKKYSSTLSHYFYKAPVTIPATARTLVAYEYWLDGDYASAVRVNAAPQQQISIDRLIQTNSLKVGVHAFNIRFRDSGNMWSSTLSHYFYKAPVTTPATARTLVAYEYWLDGDYASAVRVKNPVQEILSLDKLIDVKNLSTGLHTFNIHFSDNSGVWSSPLSHHFYKMHKMQQIPNFISGYRYWFDADFSSVTNVPVNPVVEQFYLDKLLDISQVPGGKHTINFQFRDALGLWSVVTADSITTTDVIKINLEVEVTGNEIKSKQDNAAYQWLDCDKNKEPIAGATQQSYTVTKSGNYAVEIAYMNKKDTTACSQVTYLGLESNNYGLNAHIWPNPTNGPVQINLRETYREIRVSITDISGKVIRNVFLKDQRLIQQDLSGQSPGVYFVTITADGRTGKLKLLKK